MKTQITRKQFLAIATLVSVSVASAKDNNIVSGLVIPDQVAANEPFSFAVTGSVTGEVVEVKTVDGEVVARPATDKYGRVFLAAGLAAGAYVIRAATQPGPAGRITVNPDPAPTQITKLPDTIQRTEPIRVTGNNFSPYYGDMDVRLGNQTQPVLAATRNQIVTAAPSDVEPGLTKMTVANRATGETIESPRTLVYEAQGQLKQRKLVGGQATVLEIQMTPKSTPAEVRAEVASGPVQFVSGGRETVAALAGGFAMLPLRADTGSSGPFQLTWAVHATLPDGPSTPQEWLKEKGLECGAGSKVTENSQNEKDLKAEAKLDTDLAAEGKNWDKDGQPKDKKKFADFLNAEVERLNKIAKKEGDHAAKDNIDKAIKAAYKAADAAGLKLK